MLDGSASCGFGEVDGTTVVRITFYRVRRPPGLRASQRLQFIQEPLHVVQGLTDVGRLHLIFMEVAVECFGNLEPAKDITVAGFRPEMAGNAGQVTVFAMLPAPTFGNRLQHLGGGAPALLGGLYMSS